jgi:hypothetical protein
VRDVGVIGVFLAALEAQHLTSATGGEHPVREAFGVVAERLLESLVETCGEAVDRHHETSDDELLALLGHSRAPC